MLHQSQWGTRPTQGVQGSVRKGLQQRNNNNLCLLVREEQIGKHRENEEFSFTYIKCV